MDGNESLVKNEETNLSRRQLNGESFEKDLPDSGRNTVVGKTPVEVKPVTTAAITSDCSVSACVEETDERFSR